MWARVMEFALGCWVLCSPFIFRAEHRGAMISLVDFACGAMIISFALLSYLERTRYAHLGTLVLSLGMIIVPRVMLAPEVPPAGENFMMIGLLLLMFAMVPNQASRPPQAWQLTNDG